MDKADTNLIVRFFTESQENPARSLAEGRPIFDEVECISIRVLGSRDEVVHLVSDEHRERFREIYQNWKYDKAQPVSGTPLEEWPPASKSFIDEMRVFGIRSVEQLAAVDDSFAMSKLGLLNMRAKAQAFIETAKDSAVPAAIAAENEALKAQMAALEARMAAFLAAAQTTPTDEELEALTAPTKRTRAA